MFRPARNALSFLVPDEPLELQLVGRTLLHAALVGLLAGLFGSAFHNNGGQVRRRVLWAKPLAAIATLGTGGAEGREGPTMQIGAAIGSVIDRYLSLTARERRTLMVAGIGAGISAVFRTPLGAALLAIEVLYRDDFESEALIPCVLASVVAYSVALSVFGTEPLFGKLDHFPSIRGSCLCTSV